MKKRVCALLLFYFVIAFGDENLLARSMHKVPAGRYYIARENLTGPEFAEFDYFEIQTKTKRKGTLYSGKLFAKTNGGYAELTLRTIKFSSKQLHFETNLVNGVCFIFDGRFIRQWQEQNRTSCLTILRGKLKEIDKREGITENDFRFKYMPSSKTGSCP